MILKRIAEGIKNQDWFVVMIEVLIVVVGIFIGLQVDDWNDERKDRILEKDFLQRLSKDIEDDIIQINIARELSMERQAYGEFLYASLKDPNLVQKEPTRFIKAVAFSGRTFTPSISSHTFEEIKSSGQLALITDVKIRSGLTRYYLRIEQGAQWSYIRELRQTEYIKRAVGILNFEQRKKTWNSENAVFSINEAQTAYDLMIAKPEFTEWLAVTTGSGESYKAISGMATNLLNIIKSKGSS